MSGIEITLNGQAHSLSAPCSLEALTRQLALDLRQIAIEHNRCVVPRSTLADVTLQHGDDVEIVELIGGG